MNDCVEHFNVRETFFALQNPKVSSLSAKSGKNTFLVIVVGTFKFANSSHLLTQIKIIRRLNSNVKIGIFFDRSITSSEIIKKLFHWCWDAGIVNIFSAFYFRAKDDGRSSFNIFKYDPFETFDLINVTRSESLRDIFPNKFPNYRKHPMRFVRVVGMRNLFYEVQLLDTLLRSFNASMSLTNITYKEATSKRAVDGILLQGSRLRQPTVAESMYPYKHSMLMLIVPHAKPYSDFGAYLQNGTWKQVFTYTLVVVVLSSLFLTISIYLRERKVLPFQCVADVINLLINDNSTIKYENLDRSRVFVIVPLTFAGLIVMNGIVSIFQSYITAPIYQPQMNSLKDLYTSTVSIMTNKVVGKDKFVNILKMNSEYDGWNSRVFETNLMQLSKEILKFNNSIAFFLENDQARALLEVQKRLSLKAYHLLIEEFSFKTLISFRLSPDFPFTEYLNDVSLRLSRAGLTNNWLKEDNEYMFQDAWKLNLNREIHEEPSVSEFTVPTIVWCGWITSVLVFICEIFWNKVKGKKTVALNKFKRAH